MNTKLTLNVNKSVIDNAKHYAKENRTSISKLIENYLCAITSKTKSEEKVSALVESLTGVIPFETEEEYKKEYAKYLNKKYM